MPRLGRAVRLTSDDRYPSGSIRASLLSRSMTNLIKQAIVDDGLTQGEFAQRLGRSRTGVSSVLNGNNTISIRLLETWAAVLGYRFEVRLVKLPRQDRRPLP
jgi:transcriptional regulator with XRE-family HTH domain